MKIQSSKTSSIGTSRRTNSQQMTSPASWWMLLPCLLTTLRRWRSRSCRRLCSTSRLTQSRKLPKSESYWMSSCTIGDTSLSVSTMNMRKMIWTSRKTKRKKCRVCVETTWNAPLSPTLHNLIVISRRKRCVVTAKIKISRQATSAKYAKCLLSLWSYSTSMTEESKFQLNTTRKLPIKFLCWLMKPRSDILRKKILTLSMRSIIKLRIFLRTVINSLRKTLIR